MPSAHILKAPTRLMKELGYGEGYEYDPDAAEGFAGVDFLSNGVERQPFTIPPPTVMSGVFGSAWTAGRLRARKR